MVKEDVIVALIVFSLALLITTYLKENRLNFHAMRMMCCCLVVLGLAILFSVWASPGEFPNMLAHVVSRWEYVLPAYEVAKKFVVSTFSLQSLSIIFAYLAPLGFLPLLSPKWASGGLCILLISLLPTYEGQYVYIRQYSGGAIPFLFMGLIASLATIRRKMGAETSNQTAIKYLFPMILLIMVLSSFLVNVGPQSRLGEIRLPDQHSESVNKILSLIPDGVTVTASDFIFPHICNRTDAYLAPVGDDLKIEPGNVGAHRQRGYPSVDTEYVVTDTIYKFKGVQWDDQVQFTINQKYELLEDINGARLYKLRLAPK